MCYVLRCNYAEWIVKPTLVLDHLRIPAANSVSFKDHLSTILLPFAILQLRNCHNFCIRYYRLDFYKVS